ncbi:MAG TPA: hemolysin family protein [Actinomycetes bacterium]|nr:hemolysin family protein [Actinomycetes bacterium]
MSDTLASIGLVLVFILIGGFFAAAEIALVSLREGQVRTLGDRGRRGAKVAALHEDPNRFLAAVQVGVTLAGFLSAAFGAATLADDLAPVLRGWGLSDGAATAIALVSITLVISYFSLVLGELAPKRLALQRAEGIALAVAPLLDRMARLSRPVIWLLSVSTDLVVRLLGGNPQAAREVISEEELRDMVAGHESLTREERRLIDEVFDAGERQLHEVMVPRTEVDFLDASLPVYKAAKQVGGSQRSRYPVVRGSHDEVVGFVHVRDLFVPEMAGRGVRLEDIVRDVMMLPGTKKVLPALQEMRREGHHLAIVLDEYGGTDGIVTLEDLVEELVGDIRDEYDVERDDARRLLGGGMDVDGLLNLEDFADRTGLALPEGPYETVAGFVMTTLGQLPEVGDTVDAIGHRFTVTELDGRRVARLRVTTAPGATPGQPHDRAAG